MSGRGRYCLYFYAESVDLSGELAALMTCYVINIRITLDWVIIDRFLPLYHSSVGNTFTSGVDGK